LSNFAFQDVTSGEALQKPTTIKKKKNGYRIHRDSYTAHNHVQVLFQMYGSAFPNVLPFAVINMIWTCAVEYLHRADIVDLTLHSSIGHSFMGLLVSFLIVSRSKISYDRFMEFRRHLATAYRTCREIAHSTTVYTFAAQTPAARAWRQEVCFRTILLLRVTMDALLWSSTERDQWEEEYFSLQEIEKDESSENSNGDNDEESRRPRATTAAVSEHFFRFRKLSHGRRSRIDENFRAPITLGHVLKQTIMEHPSALGHKMEVNEYRDLVNFVTIFLDAFHGFRVLIITPYPFPLVQMTRAFYSFGSIHFH
jgi:Bestrophin, RFP-TM, chloride channel